MQDFAFNIHHPVLQNRQVRQAISLLSDFEWLNKRLFSSSYKRTSSYFESSKMAAHQLPNEVELKILELLRGRTPDGTFDQAFQDPVNGDSGVIRGQRRKAYQLFTEADYRIRDNHTVGPDGQPPSLGFMLFQADMERVIPLLKHNLAGLDIDMRIHHVDVPQFVNHLRSRDFDMTSTT